MTRPTPQAERQRRLARAVARADAWAVVVQWLELAAERGTPGMHGEAVVAEFKATVLPAVRRSAEKCRARTEKYRSKSGP